MKKNLLLFTFFRVVVLKLLQQQPPLWWVSRKLPCEMTFWPRISYVMSTTHSGSGGLFSMRSRGRGMIPQSANSCDAQCTKMSAVNFLVGAHSVLEQI